MCIIGCKYLHKKKAAEHWSFDCKRVCVCTVVRTCAAERGVALKLTAAGRWGGGQWGEGGNLKALKCLQRRRPRF